MKLRRIWYYWAKALGEKASPECNKTADKVALIRTVIFFTYLLTNVAIIANAIRHWNDMEKEQPVIVNVMRTVDFEDFEKDFDYYYSLVENEKETIIINYVDEDGVPKRTMMAPIDPEAKAAIGRYLEKRNREITEREFIDKHTKYNSDAP